MATQTEARTLPYGVGRFSPGWLLVILVFLAFLALGLFAYSQQLTKGEIVTGMRDVGTGGGAPWGIYVAFVVYFIGVSFAGVTVAALVRLMNLEYLRPIARMAEVMTIIALVLGALSIIADWGQPLRGIVNFFLYARPTSPFFGTFTLVIAGYLFASVVFLYLAGRRDAALLTQRESRLRWLYRMWAAGYRNTPAERERHRQTSFWLALSIIPLLIAAHSTLGFVFGIQIGRPGWYSSLQAPGFVVLAGVSGMGLLAIVAGIIRRVLGEREQLNIRVFAWLSNVMMILTITYLYFLLVEILTATFAGHSQEVRVSEALLTGTYAPLFWTAVGLLAIAAIIGASQAFTRRYSVGLIVLAGVMVNVAAMLKRYLIVVPSLTHGSLLPYPVGEYSPTWVEYGYIAGLFALGILAFIAFMKMFPIMEIREPT